MLLCALLAACVPADALGQGGYFYRSYSSYYYPRPFNNTYHGYWRDLGYGFSNRPAYGGYRYSAGYFPGPAYPAYGPSYYGGYYSPPGGSFGW
jgi:hypothetical protein